MAKKTNTVRLICLFPGLFLIISGALLLFFPEAAKTLYGMPDAQVFRQPVAHAMGIRQLALGLIICALALAKETRALGIVMMLGALVPLADFQIFRPVIGNFSALRHLATVPLIFGLGFYLYRNR